MLAGVIAFKLQETTESRKKHYSPLNQREAPSVSNPFASAAPNEILFHHQDSARLRISGKLSGGGGGGGAGGGGGSTIVSSGNPPVQLEMVQSKYFQHNDASTESTI
jgi:hypothetical protein